MYSKTFMKIIDKLSILNNVDAIVLGGSMATSTDDEASDYDVYVYVNEPISILQRKQILNSYCKYTEINNTYWETEDDCIMNNDIQIEIIYRNIKDIQNNLESVLINHNASCGYTTCFCYNIFNSKVLYDPKNIYSDMVLKYSFEYPKKLAYNIIKKNRNLLKGKMPCYYDQIEKAIKRNDIVSINHRTSEFLASYFDILFAINMLYHPGEKKLIKICLKMCKILPLQFEDNIAFLLNCKNDKKLSALNNVINKLDLILKKHSFNF